MVATAQHRQERLVTSSALSSILEGELVPGNYRVDVPTHPGGRSPRQIPPREGGARPARPVSRYRPGVSTPVDGHGMTTVAEEDHLRRTGQAVDTQHVKLRSIGPEPHPIEAERPNRALSSPDTNRVECRHGLGGRRRTLQGMLST